MNLSPNFTLEELTVSQEAARRGLDNTPSGVVLANLTATARKMEAVRELLDCPIIVSSGYRSPAVNKAVGGAPASQHLTGQAVDFTAPRFGPPLTIAHAIKSSSIQFDQLIQEGNWVHISFVDNHPRRQVLTASFSGGSVSYRAGL